MKLPDGTVGDGNDMIISGQSTTGGINGGDVIIKGGEGLANDGEVKITTPDALTDLVVIDNTGDVTIAGDVDASNFSTGGKTTTNDIQIGAGATTTGYVLTDTDGAGNASWGQVGNAGIANDAVTTDKIADGTVGAADIGTGAVGSDEIAADAVGSSEIATGAVGTDEIADDAVTSTDIQDGTIVSVDIATDGITATNIAPGAVGTSEILNESITASDIGTGAVNSDEIATDAVGSDEISTGAVGSDEIAGDAVGSSEIAADAVGSSEIATDAVGTDEIAAGAVNTAEIADDAVTKEKVNADVAGDGLIQAFDGSLEVNDGDGLDITGDQVRITPGSSEQILRTNTGGTGVEWVDESVLDDNDWTLSGTNDSLTTATTITDIVIGGDADAEISLPDRTTAGNGNDLVVSGQSTAAGTTGGDLNLRAGEGLTVDGDVNIQSGDGATDLVIINSSGDVTALGDLTGANVTTAGKTTTGTIQVTGGATTTGMYCWTMMDQVMEPGVKLRR